MKSENTQEMETGVIEYVGEEFIDEDTNDGFEDENGVLHQEEDDDGTGQITIETTELGKFSSSIFC